MPAIYVEGREATVSSIELRRVGDGVVIMHARAVAVSDEEINWTIRELLEPALYVLIDEGRARRPQRCTSDDAYVRDIGVLVTGEMKRLRAVKERFRPEAPPQDGLRKLAVLTARTGFKRSRLFTLLFSLDWEALRDEMRFRASSLGRLPLGESVLVHVGVPRHVNGANVFGADCPVPPSCVADVLGLVGRSWEPGQHFDTGYETSMYLIEVSFDWLCAHRVESLPEGTYFDQRHAGYPPHLRPQIEAALREQARPEHGGDGRYEVDTEEIVRGQVRSFFDSARLHVGPAAVPRMPVESGVIARGNPPARWRYLGGDLAHLQHVERAGGRPSLALPRLPPDTRRRRGRRPDPALSSLSFQTQGCTFEVGRPRTLLDTVGMNWAMAEFLRRAPDPRFPGIFAPVEPEPIKDAGGDPAEVVYGLARAQVGKGDGPRWAEVSLLLANRLGELAGWGILPAVDPRDEAAVVELIRWAERHVARTAKGGVHEELIAFLQCAGLQTFGIERRANRVVREGLLLTADLLLTRAELLQ